jgi:hypothetical protein
MSQADQTATTIPARRRRPAAAPAVMPIQFDWSKDSWVACFVPGSTDIGTVVLLHHDAAELERIVAGLVAFRKQASRRLGGGDGRARDSRSGDF